MKTMTIDLDENKVWYELWGSNPEAFGSHWTELEFLDGADWDKIGTVKVSMLNSKYEKVTKILDIDDIFQALPIANQQVYMDLFNFDNYDCVCSDAIIQVAMLGKVVWG